MDANTVVLSLDAYHELLEFKHLVEEKYDVTRFYFGVHKSDVRHIKGDEVISSIKKDYDELSEKYEKVTNELKEVFIEKLKLKDEVEELKRKQKPYFYFLK